WEKFKAVIRKAIRFLDNVIDANYYALEAVEKGTKQSRKIGLGFMGYQDMIEKLKLPVDSKEALKLLDKIGETMSYVAIETSVELAKERGTYPNFEGSDWSKGILPIDTLEHLFRERFLNSESYVDEDIDYKKLVDKYVGLDDYETKESHFPMFDWEELREKVKQGIRNACQTTLAPTATISIIAGTSQSFEPYYALVYSRTNIAGRFLEVNENFINDLKRLGLWDKLREDVLLQQGSIQDIKEIPQEIKNIYKTAYEIDTEVYIKQAAVLQKWIDSSISRNLYFNTRDPQKIMEIYLKAWKYGLKATYYAFMPAKIKTEGKYVHEDLKEQQSPSAKQDIEQPKERSNRGTPADRGTLVASKGNGKKEKSNTPEILPLDEVMKQEGYCEECGN
ncbi:MAG: ribonucleoside-diphosphate reductase, partial [Hydrogenobaculum sp.]